MSFSAGNQTKIRPHQQGHFHDLLLAQPSRDKPRNIVLRVTSGEGRITVAVEEIGFQDETYRFKGKWGDFNVTGDYWVDEADSANDTGSVVIADK